LKAIILSAGRGKRLLPLTSSRPKCLVQVAGKSILEWQLRALDESGVTEATVVTGFASEAVDAEVARVQTESLAVRTVFNPFYGVADNIGSCYLARGDMADDFILLNGDTLVEPAIVAKLLKTGTAPVNVTVDRKTAYDDDDMKVTLDGGRLTAIGKTLPRETVDAESIGLLAFRGAGPRAFAREIEAVMRAPEGLSQYYLSVIDRLAPGGQVGVVDIAGMQWSEVDYLEDLENAERLAKGWLARQAEPRGKNLSAVG